MYLSPCIQYRKTDTPAHKRSANFKGINEFNIPSGKHKRRRGGSGGMRVFAQFKISSLPRWHCHRHVETSALLCAACGCVALAVFDGVTDKADCKWRMDRWAIGDLKLDRIRFRSTEIGAESESVPRSVHSLVNRDTILVFLHFVFFICHYQCNWLLGKTRL